MREGDLPGRGLGPPPTIAGADAPWWGARKGGTETSARPGGSNPETEWMRVTSSASSRASVGRMPGSRRASIVFPVPGGPMSRRLCEPAAAISSARRARSWPRRSARSGTAPFSIACSSIGSNAGAPMSSAEVLDDLGEMPNGDRLDSGESRLGRRLGSADETSQSRAARSLGDRERPGDGTDAPVECELADRGVLREPLGRQLPRRSQNRQRDREVESRSLLSQRRGREVHGDAPVERPLERRRHDAAPHAVLRLLAGAIRQADDREARDARLKVRLDLDLPRLEADECVGHRACEHRRHGAGKTVTDGDRLPAKRATTWLRRVAEAYTVNVLDSPAVVAADGRGSR